MANNNDNQLAQVFHFDLYGKRQEKYSFLLNNDLQTVKWQNLELREPQYFFTKKDFSQQEDYEQGFSVQELFPVNSVGVVTANDSVFVNDNRNDLRKNIREHFNTIPDETLICKINYRPFDNQYIYYDVKKVERARENVMQHFLKGENVGLVVNKREEMNISFAHVFLTKNIAEHCLTSIKTINYVFPLYLYPETDKLFADEKRRPNLKKEIVDKIAQQTELQFTEEKEDAGNTFAPIDILDYIYAVLHSPMYRKRYKEFLKIDFPRIPHPENAEQLGRLAGFGEKLRKLHLMENVAPQKDIANFPVPGTNEIENSFTEKSNDYHDGKVWINDAQYFDNVPQTAWEFYIGGYQPAQKWLKDRKGRKLGFDDVQHYQRIIAVLAETERIMREIDVNLQKVK